MSYLRSASSNIRMRRPRRATYDECVFGDSVENVTQAQTDGGKSFPAAIRFVSSRSESRGRGGNGGPKPAAAGMNPRCSDHHVIGNPARDGEIAIG